MTVCTIKDVEKQRHIHTLHTLYSYNHIDDVVDKQLQLFVYL